jgi:pullulanase/glycogen debranching enzyme
VVYNHTAEGDEHGPIYSYKGIDNGTYYLLSGQPGHPYANFSGTGNTLRGSSPYVRKMIVDSAHYWVEEMHVDGFRFDLASALARNDDGSLNWEDPIDLVPAEPAHVRLIAEPWDAAGAYQLGRTFPVKSFFQWNGRFRDDVRRFVRGDTGMVPTLMQRLYGSDDLSRTTGPMRFILTRASTTSTRMMVSLCTTSFPTIANTTRPTAITIRTAPTRTSVRTAAGKETRVSRRPFWSCASGRRRTSAAC